MVCSWALRSWQLLQSGGVTDQFSHLQRPCSDLQDLAGIMQPARLTNPMRILYFLRPLPLALIWINQAVLFRQVGAMARVRPTQAFYRSDEKKTPARWGRRSPPPDTKQEPK